MFKILLIIIIAAVLYKAYQKQKNKQDKRVASNNFNLSSKDFSGVSSEPEWWEFGKRSARKKEIDKSKHIFMNTLRKQQGRRK